MSGPLQPARIVRQSATMFVYCPAMGRRSVNLNLERKP